MEMSPDLGLFNEIWILKDTFDEEGEEDFKTHLRQRT